MARRALRLVVSAAVGASISLASVSARIGPRAPSVQQTQLPTFRAGVNVVLVDAYPVLDGKIVEGLTPDDFEILEDGKPQKIDSFEFVRIEPSPEAMLKDPNTVDESLKLAADPHNRVFAVFLDTRFVGLTGSHNIQRPLVNMLDRLLAPNDLFGVLIEAMEPRDITFARKTDTVDAELRKMWTWGVRDSNKVMPEGELAI